MKTNELFKKIREEVGLSQVQMAELCETTQGTISHIENSVNSNPSFDIISKYVAKVGANPAFLFGLDPSASPILHPTVMRDRLAGGKNPQLKNKIAEELESIIKKVKSL